MSTIRPIGLQDVPWGKTPFFELACTRLLDDPFFEMFQYSLTPFLLQRHAPSDPYFNFKGM